MLVICKILDFGFWMLDVRLWTLDLLNSKINFIRILLIIKIKKHKNLTPLVKNLISNIQRLSSNEEFDQTSIKISARYRPE